MLISEGDVGEYAHSGYAICGGLLFIEAAPPLKGGARSFFSADLGATWAPTTGACAAPQACGSLAGAGIPQRGGGVRGLGGVAPSNPFANATSFSAPAAFEVAPAPGGGGVRCSCVNASVSFARLPRPASCGAKVAFGCPFRVTGGGFTALPGGALLYTPIVRWASGGASPATSVAAFTAARGGGAWAFAGEVGGVTDFPLSQEGPNENAVSLASDGTVVAVVRLDCGDGPSTHPFVNYTTARSSDGGARWALEGAIPNAGCARPRLLHLGADGRGGVAPAPLLLSGGRQRDAAHAGWDATLWLSPDGLGRSGGWLDPVSLTGAHNRLLRNASWAFTPALNDSSAPRQCTSYTSLFELDGGPAPGANKRRLGVSYNRRLPPAPDMFFFMPFTVEW